MIEDVIREHHVSRTHKPAYCCPEDEAVYDRLLVRMLVEKLTAPASAAPVVGKKKVHDYEAGFLRTIADALRHAIRDHGPITAEWIGSASKRVYSRLRGTKYAAATAAAPVEQSDDPG